MTSVTNDAPYRFERFTGTGLAILRCHTKQRSIVSRAARATSSSSTSQETTATFSHLAFTFPLKLISPRSASRDATARIARAQKADDGGSHADAIKPVAALFVVGYGGGLVSGDTVSVDLDVGQGCTMLLLTQGSTKVYKMRGVPSPQTRTAEQAPIAAKLTTSQTFRCIVRSNATLIVLPDPVTCFARARYSQTQRFDLRDPHSSSLVLLDWFTPGRVHLAARHGKPAMSEKWAFDSYQSRNEVRVGAHVIARDVLLLEQDGSANGASSAARHSSIARKCEPYSCFATLIMFGQDVQPTVMGVKQDFYAIQQHSRTKIGIPQDVLWSCSPLTKAGEDGEADTGGLVVRVAGLTTEMVRDWLRQHLVRLKALVGDDLYRQALG